MSLQPSHALRMPGFRLVLLIRRRATDCWSTPMQLHAILNQTPNLDCVPADTEASVIITFG